MAVRQASAAPERRAVFTEDFTVGSDPDCDWPLEAPQVARRHLLVMFDGRCWWLRDVSEGLGVFVEGQALQVAPFTQAVTVQLGRGGPKIELQLAGAHSSLGELVETRQVPPAPASRLGALPASDTTLIENFFRQNAGAGVEVNIEALQALSRVRSRARRHRRRLALVAGALSLALLLAIGLVSFLRQRVREQAQKLTALEAKSEDLFYAAKTLEVQISKLETVIQDGADPRLRSQLEESQLQLKSMADRYDAFVRDLGLYRRLSPRDQVIVRVARQFGECEVNVPDGFMSEVHRYLELLKSRDFFPRALARARAQYAGPIADTFVRNHLPPQYLYLALQESGFDDRAVGPGTRYGYAKGMWQFIAPTARDYGLRTGPLYDRDSFDASDDRFDWRKETVAAARYIHDLNANITQGSGLLAMACYNWGENNVRAAVEALPKTARDRNFWTLLTAKKVPAETYDYVLSIFSMAVICEDPALFGYAVECPAPARRAPAGEEALRVGG